MTVLTGGVALLGALAGGALGLLAQKMGLFGDKTSEAAEKAKALAAALPKDDPKSIRTEQADRAVLSYMRQLEVLQQMAPIEADRYKNGVLDYEIQKNITTENAKLLELGTQLTDKEKQKAIAAITANTLAKESANVQKTILDLSNQITENGIVDTDERKIQVEMDKMKLQYSTQTYEKYKDQVAALMRQNELIQAQTKLAEAVKTTPSVSEMGTQGASILQSDTTTGIIAQQQRTMATLDFLKQQGYLKDKQYADLQIQAEADKNAAILALDQKLMDSQMKLAGVTNQAIVTAVKDQMANIQMIQQGGIAGIQGMLGGLDNVFASLGTYNREAFEAHKSLATAMALISTYQAVATSLATIPWPFSLVAAAGAFAAGMAQVSAIQSQTYTGKAIGGPVSNTQSYLVGENGPEIFTPSQNGTITPNKDMKDSGTTNINFNIQANDAQGFDDLLVQRKGMVTQMVRDAIAEQGQRIRI
jgi:hypothetical protein